MQTYNCLNCEFHNIINDPDPFDWFCDNDVAIVCSKLKNDNLIKNSPYLSDRNEYKIIQSSLRPYEVKNVKCPIWCPLKTE